MSESFIHICIFLIVLIIMDLFHLEQSLVKDMISASILPDSEGSILITKLQFLTQMPQYGTLYVIFLSQLCTSANVGKKLNTKSYRDVLEA